MAVPRRLRNTNTHPENGSSASFSWQSRAKESIPLRPSTGSMATNTRICAVIWIILPHPARRAASRPNPAGRPPSTGCASCRRLADSNSMTQSSSAVGCGAISSTNAGLAAFRRTAGNSAEPFLQTHIVQPQRVRDGVYTVLPASSTAACQSDSGSFVRR